MVLTDTQFQRNASQVRVNTLCISLISFITPNLIWKCNLQQKFEEELQNKKSCLGINVQENYNSAIQTNYNQCAYFEKNETKDNVAKRIFSFGGIQKYEYSIDKLYIWVKSETKSNSTYTICLIPIEKASCQCLDFLFHGGACKHMHAAILCINWIRQEPQNQHLPYIFLPTIEELQELHTLNIDESEETIQNKAYNIGENIYNQSSESDNYESDKEYKNFESSQQLSDKDFSSSWFLDFQNTNSLALQEQEFHNNCHSVLNHLNNLKEIAKFFNNFDLKNITQNNEINEQFELGRSALNELIQEDSLEKIYLAFQSLKLQKQK